MSDLQPHHIALFGFYTGRFTLVINLFIICTEPKKLFHLTNSLTLLRIQCIKSGRWYPLADQLIIFLSSFCLETLMLFYIFITRSQILVNLFHTSQYLLFLFFIVIVANYVPSSLLHTFSCKPEHLLKSTKTRTKNHNF